MNTFYLSEAQKRKETEVKLTKHDAISSTEEYYSYIVDGKKFNYTNSKITTENGKYYGQIKTPINVQLTYVEGVIQVLESPEHFTYIDKNGVTRKFEGEPCFDNETNTYYFTVNEYRYTDEIVDLINE